MGIFSKFEGKMEDTFEGTADKMFDAPISPVQIAKKAEKQMRREKMVGAGKQYAPTLYTVLVNPDDDRRLFGYYPTLAGETETYLAAKASEQGLMMDGQPLVRFIVDEGLKHGKFDVIAEAVAAPIISQLRNEEMQRYGLANNGYGAEAAYPAQQFGRSAAAMAPEQRFEQAPYEQPHYNQYEQPYDQGYQQPAVQQAAPASNGWEPQATSPRPCRSPTSPLRPWPERRPQVPQPVTLLHKPCPSRRPSRSPRPSSTARPSRPLPLTPSCSRATRPTCSSRIRQLAALA